MSPKQSAASQPEFFVDRSLGPETAGVLRGFGWIVHLINDFFPNDAQETADEDWIAYGLQRGWGDLSAGRRSSHARRVASVPTASARILGSREP
jgi:hypothetical protein